MLLAVGGIAATYSVQRARELRTASVVDPLTRLFNRGYLNARLDEELERAIRHRRTLSLVLLDIDDFKHYNDRHGHLAGDQVLRGVADELHGGVRQTDVVARYGGEELAVLLPETAKPQARLLAERLRLRVAQHDFPFGGDQPQGAVTVSLGVAAYPDDAVTVEQLIRRADEGLYRAKRQGKNRVDG